MSKSTTTPIKVYVDNSSVMNSIESASINVTSPSGRTIRLYKRKLSHDACTQAMRDVFWKLCKDPMVNFKGEVEVTRLEMEHALAFSKLK